MRPARLDGTWTLSGWELGKGAIYGRVTVTTDPATPDEFTTSATYRVARTGETITRTGRAIVYTGFQWRGRSSTPAEDSSLREVMTIDRDWRHMEGRWFTGGYDELGLDIKLDRDRHGDARARHGPHGVEAGRRRAGAQDLRCELLLVAAAADIDLGPGLTVTRIVNVTPDVATVSVDVAAAKRVARHARRLHRRRRRVSARSRCSIASTASR